MQLAPVVVFTFNRLDHTRKTIKALQMNTLAKDTEVFIFSDGPRNEEEEIKVNRVRDYIKSINGFKNINIIKSKKNNGLAKSVIDGVTEIINRFGKVIVLEDDLISSKNFLKYMNEALVEYQYRKDIWSISGYTPRIKIPENYKDDVYLTYRGSSWGWATWEDRWNLNDWKIKDYNEFKKNREAKHKFNKSGTDMTPMLNDQMKGRINSWAIRWVYNQFKYGMLTVYPIKSLIKNIGMDLSGTHSVSKISFIVNLTNSEIALNKDVVINNYILESFKKVYDLNWVGYIAIIIKKLGMYKQARKIRNSLIIKFRYDLKHKSDED